MEKISKTSKRKRDKGKDKDQAKKHKHKQKQTTKTKNKHTKNKTNQIKKSYKIIKQIPRDAQDNTKEETIIQALFAPFTKLPDKVGLQVLQVEEMFQVS